MKTNKKRISFDLNNLEQTALVGKAVILPLSKPVLAVIFLYYLVGNWNSWFNAMEASGTVIPIPVHGKYVKEAYIKELKILFDSVGRS